MNLDKSALLDAYRRLKTIREFEMRMRLENEAGQLPGFIHLYCGQEAIAAGACMHLEDTDYIGSTHRGHGHCIAKGCDIKGMALELWCKRDGLCRGKGGSMHIADISKGMLGANAIVGGGAPLALGGGLTAKTLGRPDVSVTFGGDGAANQGTVMESLNFAVVLKLPVIFVVENNGYGEHTGIEYHLGGNDLAHRAAAFGMPAVTVDGTDFFAVYDAMEDACKRARAGQGPSTIVAVAARWQGHFEGDPQAYRDPAEVKAVRENSDCLKNFRERMAQDGLLEAAELDRIDVEVRKLIDAAVEAAKVAADPLPEDLLTDVYVRY